MALTDPIPQQYLALVEHFIATARAIAEKGEGIQNILFIGSLEKGKSVSMLMDAASADEKEAAGEHARRVAEMLDADYSLTVGEAWSLTPRDTARSEAILEDYGSVGNYPGRIEIAAFMLETRYGTWAGQAPIKFKGASKKKRTFGKVEFLKVDRSEGRLANIILKDEDASRADLQ